MDNAKSQLIEKLNAVNSVLVTVSRDPSVDQLSACIALTLLVNKLNKHGSAVFSGRVPSTIEFLKPEETLEKTADSLRDFIIALDKNKADKLRYKVEDQMVKIFITPYKTSLSEENFEFSQGDFNVELVIALGVHQQEDLDQAITAHGRILHDATVASVNTTQQGNIGSINWQEPTASSLCELVTDLATTLGDKFLDEQIATALLTGIIAETDRFSNDKTSPQTMSVAAKLMAAGANQQLVASNLNEPLKPEVAAEDKPEGEPKPETPEGEQSPEAKKADDGTLNIEHENSDLDLSMLPKPSTEDEVLAPETSEPEVPEVKVPDQPEDNNGPKIVTEPPQLGGKLTANTEEEHYDPSVDLDLLSDNIPKTTNDAGLSDVETPGLPPLPPAPAPSNPTAFTPPPVSWEPPVPTPAANPVEQPVVPPAPEHQDLTLSDLDQKVGREPNTQAVDQAREQVNMLVNEAPKPPDSMGAMPLGGPLHQTVINPSPDFTPPSPAVANTTGLDIDKSGDLFVPKRVEPLPVNDSAALVPPPVPPPIPGLSQPKPEDNNLPNAA